MMMIAYLFHFMGLIVLLNNLYFMIDEDRPKINPKIKAVLGIMTLLWGIVGMFSYNSALFILLFFSNTILSNLRNYQKSSYKILNYIMSISVISVIIFAFINSFFWRIGIFNL